MRRMFVAVLGLVLVGGCLGYQELSVSFDPAELTVPSGQVVSVDAVASGGNGKLEYEWEWSGLEGMGYGDGSTFWVSPGETFVGPKEYVIHVRVTDQCGHWATADKLVTVGSAAGHHDNDNSNDNGNDNSDNGNDNDGHQDNDNANDNGDGHHHQPPDPKIVSFTVNGSSDPNQTFTADESGDVSLKIGWEVVGAVDVKVAGADNFKGERALVSESGGEPVTLNIDHSPWILSIVATGKEGTTPATKTIVVMIVMRQSCLTITSVTVSPSCPFDIGQAVVFTVKTTGDGVLHFRLPTFTMNADWPLDPSGTTTIPYIWPFKVWPDADGSPAEAFFWPDDRNSDPDRVKVPIIFR